jgi:hypothetical protein
MLLQDGDHGICETHREELVDCQGLLHSNIYVVLCRLSMDDIREFPLIQDTRYSFAGPTK